MPLLNTRRVYVAGYLLFGLAITAVIVEALTREMPSNPPAVPPEPSLLTAIRDAASRKGTREQIIAAVGVEPDVDTATEEGQVRFHFYRGRVSYTLEHLALLRSSKSVAYWVLPAGGEVAGIIWAQDDQPHFFRADTNSRKGWVGGK